MGDSDLMQQSFSDRASRVGRRGSKTKQDTSLYTRVVSEASEYGEKLRAQFRSVKKRIQNMPPEQRMAMARKWGRPFITLAAQIAGES